MKHKFSYVFIVSVLFSFLSIGGQMVRAETNVNDSVYEYFDQQDKTDSTDTTNDKNQPATDDTNADDTTTNNSVSLSAWDIIKTILVLGFVIALLVFLLKWLQKKNNSLAPHQTMKVLGGAQLGGNRSVQMIKAGDSILIVGVGEDVQLLKEINNDQEVETIVQEYNERMDQMIQPMHIIAKIRSQMMKNRSNITEDESTFKNVLQQEMNEMIEKRRAVYQDIKKEHEDNE